MEGLPLCRDPLSIRDRPRLQTDALHTAAISAAATAAIPAVPPCPRPDPIQQLRLCEAFLPMAGLRWRVLARWRAGPRPGARWALDRPTPMERTRVPTWTRDIRHDRDDAARARALIPNLAEIPVTARWARLSTDPDGVACRHRRDHPPRPRHSPPASRPRLRHRLAPTHESPTSAKPGQIDRPPLRPPASPKARTGRSQSS